MVGRVVVVLALVAGCKAKTEIKLVLDEEKVQQGIVKWLADQEVVATVKCPETPLEKGRHLECEATEPEGARFKLDVELKDAIGNVKFKTIGVIIQMASVRKAISEVIQIPDPVQLTCNKHVYLTDETGRCTFAAGSRHGHVDVKLTADDLAKGAVSLSVVADG